jgi:histidine triad (HIT) family protein
MTRFVFLMLRRLTSFARPMLKWLLGAFFSSASFLLPVQRLKESSSIIAFWHPRPSYRIHILFVPKRAVEDLADLSYRESCELLEDVLTLSGQLVKELSLELGEYYLILNGGGYQEIPQLHFHLIAE